MKKGLNFIIFAGVVIGLGYVFASGVFSGDASSILQRTNYLRTYLKDPAAHPEWAVEANSNCGSAPFQWPTEGMVGYLWDDSFYPGHHHTGLDIFGPTDLGQTPVYAAYDGYLSRMADWKSTVILRVPSDPLQPEEQIWLYYTHMADPDGNSFISAEFPPNTLDVYVEKGTLLGYQGNYSGDPKDPVGMHLHFSIVKSDADGSFRNESKIENTLDPSPYFGVALNMNNVISEVPVCP